MAKYNLEVDKGSGHGVNGNVLKMRIEKQGLVVKNIILKYSKSCFDVQHCDATVDMVDHKGDEPSIHYQNENIINPDMKPPYLTAGNNGTIKVKLPQDFAEEFLRKLEEEIPTVR